MGHWEIQNYGSINGHNVNEWINSMNLKTWKETVLCYRKCDAVAKNGCFQHVRYFNKGLRDIYVDVKVIVVNMSSRKTGIC